MCIHTGKDRVEDDARTTEINWVVKGLFEVFPVDMIRFTSSKISLLLWKGWL